MPFYPDFTNLTGTGTFSLTSVTTPTIIASDQNDYNPSGISTCSILRLSSSSNINLSGLQGGTASRFIFLQNVGSYNIKLLHASSLSSASNRFNCRRNLDTSIPPGGAGLIRYSSSASAWVADLISDELTVSFLNCLTDFPSGSSSIGDFGYNTTAQNHLITCPIGEGAVKKSFQVDITSSSSIASTAVKTDFSNSRNFPANSITVNRYFKFDECFVYSTTGTPTLELWRYLGSNALYDTGVVTLNSTQTNQKIIENLVGIVTSVGASGNMHVFGTVTIFGTTSVQVVAIDNDVTIDTTSVLTGKCSAQWGTSSSGNTIVRKPQGVLI
jgi:hypothetical protein